MIKKKTGGSLVSNKMTRDRDSDAEDLFFQRRVSSFRSKIMQQWFDFPFLHILSIFVLLLLFAVALFSKSGVE